MKTKFKSFISITVFILLIACQPVPPPVVNTSLNQEFTLAPDQSSMIGGASLTLKLIGVSSDQRCPANIECAVSGPVSLSISIQKDSDSPQQFDLQSFSGSDGRSPDFVFEGIQDRVEFAGYLIQIKAILPYPQNKIGEINSADYMVTFTVKEK